MHFAVRVDATGDTTRVGCHHDVGSFQVGNELGGSTAEGTDKTATSLRQQAPMRSRIHGREPETWWSCMKGRQFTMKTRRSVTHPGQTPTAGPPHRESPPHRSGTTCS